MKRAVVIAFILVVAMVGAFAAPNGNKVRVIEGDYVRIEIKTDHGSRHLMVENSVEAVEAAICKAVEDDAKNNALVLGSFKAVITNPETGGRLEYRGYVAEINTPIAKTKSVVKIGTYFDPDRPRGSSGGAH